MKKLIAIALFIGLLSSAMAQCPTFPNGAMENDTIDSFYSTLNASQVYSLEQTGWYTSMLRTGHATLNKSAPGENTGSSNAYEGNHALKVPENVYILSFGDAFYLDSLSKTPSGIGGYYLTDDSVQNFTFEMTVIFSNSPSKYIINPTGFDSTEVNTYEFSPTNGKYKSFNFSFHDATVKKADSMLIHFEWFVDDVNYPFNPDFLVDSLHFSCKPPTSLSKELIGTIDLYHLENGSFLVKAPSTSEYTYRIINLNGQVLKSGSFEKEIQFDSFGEFVILQVSDGLRTKVVKVPF